MRLHTPNLRLPMSILLASILASPAAWPDQRLPAYSLAYDPERDPFADGRESLALAAHTGRRVLIEVGGDWCVWCHVLERVFADHPAAGQALRDGFVLLKVNVSDESPNTEFLNGLPALTGYPKLFVSRADGTIVHAQDPSAFVRNGRYDPALVHDFLRRWAGTEGDK